MKYAISLFVLNSALCGYGHYLSTSDYLKFVAVFLWCFLNTVILFLIKEDLI